MRTLIAIVLFIALASASRPARPHVKGYAETKHAMEELADALDALSYVFAVKGVKAYPVCGLSVPNLGYNVQAPIGSYGQPTAPKKPAYKPAVPAPKKKQPAYKPAVVKGPAPKPFVGYKAPTTKEADRYAVVRYRSKSELDEALLEASAHIVADDAAVQAKIDEIRYMEVQEKLAKAKHDSVAAAIFARELAKERGEAAKLKLAERGTEEKQKEIEQAEAAAGKSKNALKMVTEVEAPEVELPAAPAAAPAAAAPASPAAPAAPATVQTPAGKALRGPNGATLYFGPGEDDGKVHCTGQCADFWKTVAAGSIQGKGIGSVQGPTGPVATYKGRPVYSFALDSGNGASDGQNSNGFSIAEVEE